MSMVYGTSREVDPRLKLNFYTDKDCTEGYTMVERLFEEWYRHLGPGSGDIDTLKPIV